MIIGGWTDSGLTATVLKYNSRNLNNDPVQVQSMVHKRYWHACTIFKSPLHGGRSIDIVAGGEGTGSVGHKAEVLDFTQDGASWQESNIIFVSTLSVFLTFQRRSYECVRSL